MCPRSPFHNATKARAVQLLSTHPFHDVGKGVKISDVVDGGLAGEKPRHGRGTRASAQRFWTAAHAARITHVEHAGVGVNNPADRLSARSPLGHEQDTSLVFGQVG